MTTVADSFRRYGPAYREKFDGVKLGRECPQNAGLKCPLIGGRRVHAVPLLGCAERLCWSRLSVLPPHSATGSALSPLLS